MKNTLVAGTLVATALTVGCTKKLDTDIKKASYAIGQQIGTNLKTQNVDFDPEVVAMALKDAQKGESKLDKDGMQQAMMKLQEMAMQKQQAEGQENLKKSQAFLEQNKAQPNVKTTASGLQYTIITEGKGPKPTDEDVVKCHYSGTLIDGTKFDSSFDRGEPAEFPVKGVIPGWTEALKLMPAGTKAKLFIPPDLAYGAQGRPGIPANSALIFDVELIEIMKKGKKK
ncbi:MAG: FKBP-type peptidyl-prolyl cis-trans isomerase [Bdellovibrionaceae bacterium]|nr:FKBP-type peptidyl-prolyl cis-trans isomerase [Pseudobdellovibrionaceae bacterium]MBX3033152.1 FKBP-type peptidyl-prolyl cis-trans isomerase [Pseudobdellovibrionaceae bacterium]